MKEPAQQPGAQPPPSRFSFGRFACTVVSDGSVSVAPADQSFPSAEPEELARTLAAHAIDPGDRLQLAENVLVVDTGAQLVLFDPGIGLSRVAADRYGPHGGRLVEGLAAAGLSPADIDVVALTHAHPDHCWGLVDLHGAALFPGATVALASAEHAFWTDRAHGDPATDAHRRLQFEGARRALQPYAGRLRLLDGSTELLEGIEALLTPGHTPGHVVYRLRDGARSLYFWGDLCHHAVLSLQDLSWGYAFDIDPAAATQERRRICEAAAEEGNLVLSYHFPFPGLGKLLSTAAGYAWRPARGVTYQDGPSSQGIATFPLPGERRRDTCFCSSPEALHDQ